MDYLDMGWTHKFIGARRNYVTTTVTVVLETKGAVRTAENRASELKRMGY